MVMAVGTRSEFSPMMTATSRLLTGCAMVNLYVLHAARRAPTDVVGSYTVSIRSPACKDEIKARERCMIPSYKGNRRSSAETAPYALR